MMGALLRESERDKSVYNRLNMGFVNDYKCVSLLSFHEEYKFDSMDLV
nr:Uncharacterised protein [Raoultella sp. NCTC 9187]